MHKCWQKGIDSSVFCLYLKLFQGKLHMIEWKSLIVSFFFFNIDFFICLFDYEGNSVNCHQKHLQLVQGLQCMHYQMMHCTCKMVRPHEVNLVLLVRAMFLIFLVKETWWLVEMGELIWTAEFLLSDFWNSPVIIGDYFKLLYFSSTVCRTYIFIHAYIYWQYVSESIKRKLNEKRTHWVNPFTPSHQYA